jgi:proline iminopeptidase
MIDEAVDVGGGACLSTTTEGGGRPLVWCHGGPGGVDNLAPLAGLVSDGALVHRYEQRGCGRSSGRGPFTMRRSVQDLEALRHYWGHDRWVVGGHSFGAALALAYAMEHQEATEAVVWLSCIVRLDGQPDWFDTYRRLRLDRIRREDRARYLDLLRLREEQTERDPSVAHELRMLLIPAEFARSDVAESIAGTLSAELAAVNDEVNTNLGRDFERFFADPGVRQQLHRLHVPILLVHGDADPRPFASVEALAEELPNAQVVKLNDAGHFPFWEAPHELRRVLAAFLASLSQAGS